MRTAEIKLEDISSSPFTTPPLARNDDYSLNHEANKTILKRIEGGGITSVMYGGVANFYHIDLGQYEEFLDTVSSVAGPETWILPAAGPDFGRLVDQAKVLARTKFPAVMILPQAAATTPKGVDKAIRIFVEKAGRPAILYIAREDYLTLDLIASLVHDGAVVCIKYGIERRNPMEDQFLSDLTAVVDPGRVVCGLEHPVVPHLLDFRLASFTSGVSSIAPSAARQVHRALKNEDHSTIAALRSEFSPLERIRPIYGQTAVLHDALTWLGIADMGPVLPMLDNTGEAYRRIVIQAASRLLDLEESLLADAA